MVAWRNMAGDIAYAVRGLQNSPAYALVAILSIGLGIGAATSLFTIGDALLLQPIAARQPDELVAFRIPNVAPVGMSQGSPPIIFSYPMYRSLRDGNDVFSGLLGRSRTQVSLTAKDSSERVRAELVTGNYFDVLGMRASAGRLITPDDDRIPGGHPVVVLSHGFWLRRFAGDRNIPGSAIMLNGRSMTVLGVAAPGFQGVEFTSRSDLFLPMAMAPVFYPGPDRLEDRQRYWVNVMARLKPGRSLSQANASVNVLFRQLLAADATRFSADVSDTARGRWLAQTIQLEPGRQGFHSARQQAQMSIAVLLGAAGFVLLIACANVANLMLVRAVKRAREFAVRVAIGASPWHLTRQVLTESMVVALAGGAIGIALAYWGTDAIVKLLPSSILMPREIVPDMRAVLFAAALACITALLFGVIPAFRTSQVSVAPALKSEAAGVLPGGRTSSMRNGLVVVQVALALILIVGAALLLSTLNRIYSIDLGFNRERLLLMTVNPGLVGYTPEKAHDFVERLQEQVEALPGVRAVALAKVPVVGNNNWSGETRLEGKPRSEGFFSRWNWVAPRYFQALGVRLLGGREISSRDSAEAPKVALVNETFARRYFSREGALGRHFGTGGRSAALDTEIIGVVKDFKYRDARETPEPTVYFSYMQSPHQDVTLHVRMAGPTEAVVSDLRRIVHDMDPVVPTYDVKTLETHLEENASAQRFMASLSIFFGCLATLLAAIGLYGVLAFSVARRTREIGIRMALGAERRRVLWMVMKETLTLTFAGLLLGLFGAWAVTRYLKGFLYEVKPMEPALVLASAFGICVVAMVSGYLPARRASRTDPIRALRYD